MTPLEKYVISCIQDEVSKNRIIAMDLQMEHETNEKTKIQRKYAESLAKIDSAFTALYVQYEWQDRKLKDDLPF